MQEESQPLILARHSPRRRVPENSILMAAAPLIYLAVSTGFRLIAGLAQLKYVAWQFGPAKFGLFTQVMGVVAIFYMFAGGAVTWGLIRNIAAARSEAERERWMSAASAINASSSVVLALVAIGLAIFEDGRVIGDPGYSWIYLGIAVTQPSVGLGNLILAYYSATGDFRSFSEINIFSTTAALVVMIGLGLGFGFDGAVGGLVCAQATLGVVALWYFHRVKGGRRMLRIVWEWSAVRCLISHAAVLGSSAAAVPAAQLLLRNEMGDSVGWDFVGYWQSVNKLSDAYMAFIGIAFVNYLLPLLARQEGEASAIRTLWRFDAPLLVGFAVTGGAIYAMRDALLSVLYSEQFLRASEFILPQLVGDLFRIAAWSLSYYFISRGQLLVASSYEVGRAAVLVLFYLVFAGSWGPAAPLFAHVATYTTLLAVLLGLLLRFQKPFERPATMDQEEDLFH
jgi:O-antigen/teichoic acid export membrane protein